MVSVDLDSFMYSIAKLGILGGIYLKGFQVSLFIILKFIMFLSQWIVVSTFNQGQNQLSVFLVFLVIEQVRFEDVGEL